MIRAVAFAVAVVVSVAVAHRIYADHRQRVELERLAKAAADRIVRQAAARMASEIRNARRRQTADQQEQVHDQVQRWLTDALRVREAGLVQQFRKELDEL